MASDILTGRYLISTPLDCDSIECSNLIPGSPSYRASKYYPRTEVSLSLTGHSPSSLNISEFSSTINHIDAFYFTTHLLYSKPFFCVSARTLGTSQQHVLASALDLSWASTRRSSSPSRHLTTCPSRHLTTSLSLAPPYTAPC